MADLRLRAANTVCEFDFEHGDAAGVLIHTRHLIAWNEDYDIALMRLNRETRRGGLRLRRDGAEPLALDERLSMIHHGLAMRKLLGLRGKQFDPALLASITTIPEHFRITQRLLYDLPTAPGSSGAPLFDDQWKLVGQHVGFLGLPQKGEVPSRVGIGVTTNDIIRFFDGEGIETDDAQLARHALEEVKSTWAKG